MSDVLFILVVLLAAALLYWLFTKMLRAEDREIEELDTAELEALRKRVVNLRKIALRGKARDN